MEEKMKYAGEILGKGYHCSQATLYYVADKLGMDPNLALKVSAGLGGGCFKGGTCGIVTGATMALSLVYGHDLTMSREEVAEKDPVLQAKVKEFQDKFVEKCGATLCVDLLDGLNISDPDDLKKIVAEGKTAKCIERVAIGCAILEEMLADELK